MSPKSPKAAKAGTAATKAAIAAAADDQAFPQERAAFRTLLLANPNHFGNLAGSQYPAVLKIAGNKFYEEIGSVGFQPQFDRLEAVVYVRQPSGYGGGVCAAGTPEYVRFYLSTDGKDWTDLGLTSFQAHDIPEGTGGGKRLEYAVSLDISTRKRFCFVDNLAQVRAILSWNAPPPPDDPGFVPVWGDVHDTNIQIAPRKLFPLTDLLAEVKVKVPSAVSDLLKATEVTALDPEPVPWTELRKAYGDKVEAHRFAHTELRQAVDHPTVHAKLQAPGAQSLAEALELDLGKLGDLLFPQDGDTSYERLEAIGLDPNVEHLVGVIRVNKPFGYSGGACTAGSREYVTFWADVDGNGTYETCLGTTSVKVHDVSSLPDKGLEYAVFLPVDFDKLRRPCWQGARVVPIRAVLSWNVPAPCANPNYIPTWGNRLETLVVVGPGSVLSGHTPIVQTVGGMDVDDINPASGLANGPAALAGFVATDSPFGGEVILTGRIANPSDSSSGAAPLKYRIEVSDDSGVSWQAVTNSFSLGLDRLLNGVWSNMPAVNQIVDGSGWYDYREDLSGGLGNAQIFPVGNVLGRWQTAGLTGRWLVRVRVKDPANPGPVWTSSAVAVRLDNANPTASITITSGNGPCGDFTVGDLIEGTYTAADEHLGSVTLSISPTNGGSFVSPAPAPAGSTMPLSRSYPFISGTADGGPWQLDTTTLGRCGYVIGVHVHDRTIVDSGWVGRYAGDVVGLCLRD
jgi:hypothetical protein